MSLEKLSRNIEDYRHLIGIRHLAPVDTLSNEVTSAVIAQFLDPLEGELEKVTNKRRKVIPTATEHRHTIIINSGNNPSLSLIASTTLQEIALDLLVPRIIQTYERIIPPVTSKSQVARFLGIVDYTKGLYEATYLITNGNLSTTMSDEKNRNLTRESVIKAASETEAVTRTNITEADIARAMLRERTFDQIAAELVALDPTGIEGLRMYSSIVERSLLEDIGTRSSILPQGQIPQFFVRGVKGAEKLYRRVYKITQELPRLNETEKKRLRLNL